MIRLPEIPGVQDVSLNQAPMRAAAAEAPARALGEVGQAIVGVSEQFQQTAEQVQKMENARMESEARMKMGTDYANFRVALEKDPDPASRIKRTQEFFAQSKGIADDPKLPPVVRQSLLLHHDELATHGMINATADAAQLAVRRSTLAMQNEVDDAIKNRDRRGARAALDRFNDTGIPLPEEMVRMRRQTEFKLSVADWESAIKESPITVEKELADPEFLKKNPNLTPDAHEALQRRAEQEANRQRADFNNDLTIAGVDPSVDDIKEMVRANVMDKATAARRIANINSAPVTSIDPAIYEETYGQIMAYDPATDPSGRVEAQMRAWIGSQRLPKQAISELNERFTEKIHPTDSKKPKSVHEAAFASKISVDFNRGDWGKFRFPVDTDNNPDTAPVMVVNAAEYEKAWKLRGEFAEQWRAVLKTFPDDVKFDQVQESYDKLKASFQDRKPVPEVRFTAPKLAIDPEAVYRTIAPKAPVFGGQIVKPAGEAYQGAAATVFGGKNDAEDNGKSALGGDTGPGGREGCAIPQDILSKSFPNHVEIVNGSVTPEGKEWVARNVRAVVRGPDGAAHVLPVADFGTAEHVWQKNGRPTLDVTEGAAKQLGGQVVYRKGGKQEGLTGLDRLDFAVVSIDTGGPLAGKTWEQAKEAWFKVNKVRSMAAATNSLIALRDAWNQAQAPEIDEDFPLLPVK